MMQHQIVRVKTGLIVKYNCESCGTKLESPLADAGTVDACPDCNWQFTVPGEATRLDLLKKQAEAKRLAEEKQAEAMRLAEEKQAEATRLAEVKKAAATPEQFVEAVKVAQAVETEGAVGNGEIDLGSIDIPFPQHAPMYAPATGPQPPEVNRSAYANDGSQPEPPEESMGLFGFIGAFVDLDFDRFVTPVIIRIVWAFAMVAAVLWVLFVVAGVTGVATTQTASADNPHGLGGFAIAGVGRALGIGENDKPSVIPALDFDLDLGLDDEVVDDPRRAGDWMVEEGHRDAEAGARGARRGFGFGFSATVTVVLATLAATLVAILALLIIRVLLELVTVVFKGVQRLTEIKNILANQKK